MGWLLGWTRRNGIMLPLVVSNDRVIIQLTNESEREKV